MIFKRLQSVLPKLLPYLVVFLASLYRPNDADLGWHLKYGEYFFNHFSLLRVNIFSSDMPLYQWNNTSWLTDLISYLLFQSGGFFALTLAGAAVITFTFFIFSKAFKVTYWQQALIFPLLWYLIEPVNTVSFRGQLMSLGLLGVLLYILLEFERGRKRILYFLPPLFLFWANLHGQFIIGLGVYTIWVFAFLVSQYFAVERKSFFQDGKYIAIISLFTILATLIHPYGLGIYKDAFTHFNNPLLKSVAEYLPPEELSMTWWNYVIIGVLLTIGAIALFVQKKWYKLLIITSITGILFTLSLYVKRYSWSMYYTTIPFLQPIANFVKPDSEKTTYYAATVLFLLYMPLLAWLKAPFTQYTSMSWNTYCQDYGLCSPQAIPVLEEVGKGKRIMTLYGWGGWMIWNYPEIKPSIDGRMHMWRDEKGYSAFEKYYSYEQNMNDINDSEYDVVYMSIDKPVFKRLMILSQEGIWNIVYQDKTSAIFVRI